jgi:hypothetical protein
MPEPTAAGELRVVSITREWGNVYRLVTESRKYGRVSQTVLMMLRPGEEKNMPEPTAADRERAGKALWPLRLLSQCPNSFVWEQARENIAAALAAVRAETRAACARVARDMMNHPVLDDDGRANAFNTSLKIADAIERSGEAADA